ncbi:MAG: DNA-deoxyinosine glycosylase [Nitrosomonas sp.]
MDFIPTVQSFPPVVGERARILILGSMPGEASLAAKQYYAHPRNAFWPIMTKWLEIPLDGVSYQERVAALQASPIALWDVLKSCKRLGSLDSNIQIATQTINDFQNFFSIYRKVTHVFFNGGKAEICFKRYVLPLNNLPQPTLIRLPSTSPANAKLSLEEKCQIWHKKIHAVFASD